EADRLPARGDGLVRPEAGGLPVDGSRLVPLALPEQGGGELVVERSPFRTEFDGLPEAGDGLVQLPPGREGPAPGGMRVGRATAPAGEYRMRRARGGAPTRAKQLARLTVIQ